MCPKFNQSQGMCNVYNGSTQRWQTWLNGVGANHVERYCKHEDRWSTSCANYVFPPDSRNSSSSRGGGGGCLTLLMQMFVIVASLAAVILFII